MKEYRFTCQHLDELDSLAATILQHIGDKKVVLFKGEMGAGKTTLIKAICKHLGVVSTVSSPTFSLVNEYHTANGEIIYHFDFYRINKLSEVYDMGYEEYFFSGHRCFIEWPEKIEPLINFETTLVHVNVKDEIRTIILRL
jgi:tRNA threonylcarbamoyladenosine biosynthesis protein TsaE